jgi:hypothetical protein
MKTIHQLTVLILAIIVSSCTKEVVGPAGPEGPAGAPGENAFVFEYTNVDFLAPDYEVVLNYADNFEAFDSDVTLVYLLWDVTTDTNGNDLEVWRQVPQSILTANGLLQYNFDFSKVDFRLFLDTEFDPSLLEPIDTDDWIVRAVVVPGQFWGGRTGIDYSDYNAVKEAYGLPEMPTQTTLKRRQ